MKYYGFSILLFCFSCNLNSGEQEEEVMVDPVLWQEISAFQEEKELMHQHPKVFLSIDHKENKYYPFIRIDHFSFMQPEMLYWEDTTGR